MSDGIIYCPHCGAAQPPLTKGACVACQRSFEKGEEADPALLAGRYLLVRPVGTGGFGMVFEARDTKAHDQRVAIKAIHLRDLTTAQVIEATDSFNREVALLKDLNHPSLPQLYDHFTDPHHWYLVMQFIEGKTLEIYTHKQDTAGAEGAPERLAPPEVLAIAVQLCNVLHYLHTRQPAIIFRDLKPGNVMYTPTGQVYLIDFGIARRYEPTRLRDTTPLGSPGFASPEQYGKAQTTPRSDIFSLGALIHALLTGHDPSETPFAFPALPPEFALCAPLLERMLAINSSDRPASIQEVREELQCLAKLPELAGSGILPGPRRSYLTRSQLAATPMPATVSGQIQHQILQKAAGQKQPARIWRITRRTALAALVLGAGVGVPLLCANLRIVTGCLSSCPPPAPGPGEKGHTLLIYRGHSNSVQTATWSPDSKRLASGGNDFMLRVWEATTGNTNFTCQHQKEVQTVAWSRNGQYIATSAWDGIVHVWDARTGNELRQWTLSDNYPLPLAWSPDSAHLLTITDVGTVQLLHLAGSTPEVLQQGSSEKGYYIPAVGWSPDGKYLAFSTHNTIEVWDMATKQRAIVTSSPYPSDISSLAWSPDGAQIALGITDITAQIWHPFNAPRRGQSFREASSSPHENVCIAWSPDGKRLATCSWNPEVHLWNTSTGQQLFAYQGFASSDIVSSVAWSPDGTRIAATSLDSEVHIWKP